MGVNFLLNSDFVGKLWAYGERKQTAVNQTSAHVGNREINWRTAPQNSLLKAYTHSTADFEYMDSSRLAVAETARETVHYLQAQLKGLIARVQSGIVTEEDELRALAAKGAEIEERIVELASFFDLFAGEKEDGD